jgi:hypothetical protein
MRSTTHFLILLLALVAANTQVCDATFFKDLFSGSWNWLPKSEPPALRQLYWWGKDQPMEAQCPRASCNSGDYAEGVDFGSVNRPMVEQVISRSNDLGECVRICKETKHCRFWQVERQMNWDMYVDWTRWSYKDDKSMCKLFESCTLGNGQENWNKCKWLGQYNWKTSYGKELYGGGLCESEVKNDPHLLGAQGTQYDFNGVPDQTFCLISDDKYAVNMHLSGYYYDDDTTSVGTLETTTSKKGVRTWIRELGFVWTAEDGVKHNLRMAARTGTASGIKRGPGFVESIDLDGDEITSLESPGHSYSAVAKGVNITMLPFETHGVMDIDVYDVDIKGLLSVTLRLRAAIPKFQLKNEAGEVVDTEVHFNMEIRAINNSPNIHGVLGQTYRADHTQRADIFKKKVKELGGPIHADEESGKGFLDGETMDYRLEDLFTTSWKFSAFKETNNPVDAENNAHRIEGV